jgi:SAM-dependent methyltransferase
MHDRGLYGVCGSLYDPPFADATFDAVWTMSTFVHVPDDRVDEALASVVALAKPGAPVAIGTWGGFDREGVHEFGEIRPYRFFSLRTHERWVATLARHASVETFDTRRPDPKIDWEYQFAIVRRR